MTDSCNKTFFEGEEKGKWEEHWISRNPTSYCTALCGASQKNQKKPKKNKDENLLRQAISQSSGRRNEPSDQLFNLSKWIIHNDTLISRRHTIRRAINGSHIGAASQTEKPSRTGSLKVIQVKLLSVTGTIWVIPCPNFPRHVPKSLIGTVWPWLKY